MFLSDIFCIKWLFMVMLSCLNTPNFTFYRNGLFLLKLKFQLTVSYLSKTFGYTFFSISNVSKGLWHYNLFQNLSHCHCSLSTCSNSSSGSTKRHSRNAVTVFWVRLWFPVNVTVFSSQLKLDVISITLLAPTLGTCFIFIQKARVFETMLA